MPSSFTVTAATNSVMLDDHRRAEASFTVYNASGQSKRGRARIDALQPEAGAWISLQGESERDFNIGGTSQFTIRIIVPPATPAGNYSFRLSMVGVDNPDDDFTEGQAMTFQVPEPEEKRRIPWKIPAIGAAVLVLVIAAGVGFIASRGGKPVQVPDVARSTVADATAVLEAAGVKVANETVSEPDDSIARGLVTRTEPSDGSEIESGVAVILFVSSGVASVIVPEVADSSLIDATRALTSAGFKVASNTRDDFSSEVKAGNVIRAEPSEGSDFESGGEVILVVSRGDAPLIVPEVAGLSVIDATTELARAGFKVASTTRDESSEVLKAGMVIGTDPPSDSSVEKGSEITLVLSLGPVAVIPDTPTAIPANTPTPTAIVRGDEDCLSYNTSSLQIVDEGASGWLLTDGRSRMLILDNEADANGALALTKRHSLQCFIGRDNARPNRKDYIVKYWKGETGISTTILSEDCLPYNPENLRIVDEGASGWLLTDGRSRMLILNSEANAIAALAVGKQHTAHCFIGRGNDRSNRRDYIVEYWK